MLSTYSESAFRRASRRVISRFSAVSRCALAALFFICTGLFGCAIKTPSSPVPPTPEEVAAAVNPAGYHLTAEAETFYYYLLLADALSENNAEVIAQAVGALLRLDPALIVFQDSAAILFAYGRSDDARRTAEEGLHRFPHDPALTFLLTEAYNSEGRLTEAADLLADYHKKKPKDYRASQELVRLYLATYQLEKARGVLRAMPKGKAGAYTELYRARLLFADGKAMQARAHLTALLRKEPDFLPGRLELGFLYESDGDIRNALSAYRHALSSNPTDNAIRLHVITLQLQQDQPNAALMTLHGAPRTPTLLLQAAARFGDAGHYETAEALLTQAAEHGAAQGETAVLLSMLRLKSTGDPLQAIPPLNDITPDNPMYAEAADRKVRLWTEAGKTDQALAAVQEAREHRPEDTNLLSLEAFLLITSGKEKKGESLLHAALKDAPRNEDLLLALARVQEAKGDKEAALQTMERIITVNPRNALALNYVGYSLAEANTHLDRALELITAALRETPDADYIVDSLAWAQYRLGRYAEAWETIRRCLSMGADEPEIWEHYAEIALVLGKNDEARKGFLEALRRNPGNEDELRRKLSVLEEIPVPE